MTVYKYSWSGPNRAVSAEKVAEHLSKLKDQYGEVTGETFLESARDERSEMHKLFDWDDTKAAEKWRVHQARTIICSIRVTIEEREEEPLVVRAFVHDKAEEPTYVHIVDALTDAEKRAQVIADAKRDAEWFRRKYKDLKEAAKIIDQIDRFIEEVK